MVSLDAADAFGTTSAEIATEIFDSQAETTPLADAGTGCTDDMVGQPCFHVVADSEGKPCWGGHLSSIHCHGSAGLHWSQTGQLLRAPAHVWCLVDQVKGHAADTVRRCRLVTTSGRSGEFVSG